MIITRTPMRISYVGGGSDFEDHFKHNFGSVIGTTINQYIYVFSNDLSEVSPERIRFTYRQTESVNEIHSLKHPVLRAVLEELGWETRINLGTFSELPAGVGLGGSSAFTVGLSHLLLHLKGMAVDPETIAKFSVRVERGILQESGGWQDQYHSAYGGFRHYRFSDKGTEVSESLLNDESIQLLNKQQLLVWVGESRNSSAHAQFTQTQAKQGVSEQISRNARLSESLFKKLKMEASPSGQFELLVNGVNEAWALKQEFTSKMSEPVREIIDIGFKNGASAAKLCGAGGSGFVLILFEEHNLENLKAAYRNHKIVFPRITSSGSQIIFKESHEN
jgi:D-glycero-alpha-D-manno-heptose-7-phosphate kinase